MEENNRKCALLGGDARQIALCRLLAADGWRVSAFGLGQEAAGAGAELCETPAQALQGAAWAALPMPADRNGLLNAPLAGEEIPLPPLLEQMPEGFPLLAGLPSPALRRLAERRGLRLLDYGALEALVRRNAAITAEAALALAMEGRRRTIQDSPCLVIGYGRIGRALCRRLAALGAKTAAAARKREDLVQARCDGLEAAEIGRLETVLPRQSIVFNTAPAPVLDRNRLALLPPAPG